MSHSRRFLSVLAVGFIAAIAGSPAQAQPASDSMCAGLRGNAYGICRAFCMHKACHERPRPSCHRLRTFYRRMTGSSIFPCENGGHRPCDLDCAPHQECRIYPTTGEAFCADTCDGFPCPNGTRCDLLPVQCVREPCPPIARCVPDGPAEICELPKVVGPCEAAIPRWWHNPDTGLCERFIYGGCGGNANNFETRATCERFCGVDPCASITCSEHQECRIYEPTGEAFCADTCEGFSCPEGTMCELVPVSCIRPPCPPIAECVPGDICQLAQDVGPCDAVVPRWWHNPDTNQCERFVWGGCGGNGNNFRSYYECEDACVCRLEENAGPCDAAIPRWWHNPETGQCQRFVWGGCGGNSNNFETQAECARRCGVNSCPMLCDPHEPGVPFPAPDGCNTCTCLADGTIACTERACPICVFDGVRYRPGDTFPAPDGCNVCTCREDGTVACTKRACPACIVDGQPHRPGDTFPTDDGCNICTCLENGQIVCTLRPCPAPG